MATVEKVYWTLLHRTPEKGAFIPDGYVGDYRLMRTIPRPAGPDSYIYTYSGVTYQATLLEERLSFLSALKYNWIPSP